jgi:2-dehydro-3-deoxygalactonokinase
MASSSIGMQELPYANLPFTVNGSKANVQVFDAREDFLHKVVLISGVKSNEDVMRGEETQLVGIITLLNLQQQETTLILPGTHSKHLHIKDGELVNLQTFITGELFSVLVNHSILKDSVEINAAAEFSDDDIAGFKLGLKKSLDNNMLNNLFTVRTNQLFNKLNRRQNFYYLSGLLIGSEINYFRGKKNMPLILCSGSNLYELYKLALTEFDLLKQTTIISADTIHQATIAGQIIIFEKNTFTANL